MHIQVEGESLGEAPICLNSFLPVMNNKSLETRSCRRFDPIFENKSKDPTGHLKEEQNCKEYCIGRQEGSVLSQSPNTPGKA